MSKRLDWGENPQAIHLLQAATVWLDKLRRRKGVVSEYSVAWWHFVSTWPLCLMSWLKAFREGSYQFEPIHRYRFSDEVVDLWSYQDRMIIALLLAIIKPTFPHLISNRCLHLGGPTQVKTAITQIKSALCHKPYRYIIRFDIKSYYASIDRAILLNQVKTGYDDPRVQGYFEQIIHHAIDDGGNVFLPQTGIPLRSSLSPFLGALYLTPLDRALENRKGIFYLRYCDDGIILMQTKAQFVRIKKVLFKILRQLTLKISPHKTHLGKLGEKGFHFLGAQFFGSRNPRSKNPAGSVTLHLRSSRRALNKVQAMKQMGVPSSDIQSYLVRSSVWWTKSIGNPLSVSDIILQWIHLVETIPSPNAHLRALGMGILFKLLGPGRATGLLRRFHA